MIPVRSTAAVAIALLFGCGLLAPPQAARADDATDVERLLRGGRTGDALARVERSLAERPTDPQLRFLYGVVLTESKRRDEAAEVFVKLTQDHPELAEPYNNLAVLHAERGEYDRARDALEAALRTHPGFATAHENLGDVYARLAAASYARARRLDPANRSAEPKLAALRGLFAPAAGSAAAR